MFKCYLQLQNKSSCFGFLSLSCSEARAAADFIFWKEPSLPILSLKIIESVEMCLCNLYIPGIWLKKNKLYYETHWVKEDCISSHN